MTTTRGTNQWIAVAGLALLLGCGDDAGADGTTTADATTTAQTTGESGDPVTGSSSGSSGSSSESTTGADSTGDASSSTTADPCALERPAIVTDIDETLTLSDAEFFMQIADGSYDPVEREGAAELITAYADLGYRIMYLTARSEEIVLFGTGETAREATDRWLLEHGFPTDPQSTLVVLAPTLVVGDATQEYKANALIEQQAMGWRFDYAYGNATTDIGAYADAGIDLAATFIIGSHAGEGGTVAVDGEGWVDHSAMHLPTVPAVPACPEGR